MSLVDLGIQIFRDFLYLTIKVLPYFLLGTVFGTLLKTYLKPQWALKYFNRGNSSVINVSLLGALLPGCACATMPMAEGIRRQGASVGTTTAFIMMSPLLSPVTIALTYSLLGWEITLARLLFPFVGSIALGITLNYLERARVRGFFVLVSNPRFVKSIPLVETVENPQPSNPGSEQKEGFWRNLLGILRELTKYFLLGMFIASVLTTIIPEDSVPKYIGSSGLLAYIIAALVGIPFYVCEGEEVPITYALLNLGLGVGPAFTFLLGSVGTCIPTMVMSKKVIGIRATIFYVVSWFAFAIGSGWVLSLIY